MERKCQVQGWSEYSEKKWQYNHNVFTLCKEKDYGNWIISCGLNEINEG